MRRVLIPQGIAPAIRRPAPGPVASLRGPTMGTTWSVRWAARDDRDRDTLAGAIQAVLDRIVREMSPWLADSNISAFNRAPAGSWHRLPDDFRTVMQRALAVAALTDGAYDPTIGELVDAWGFGPGGPRERNPSRDEIADALTRCGWQRLRTDDDVRLRQPGGLRLDLSSIAKGYAVDCISRTLAARGLTDHLVEVGGELRGAGIKPDGEPWWVALEDPFTGRSARPDAWPETIAALHDLAIATSGDSQRFVERGGRRLSHTIDPRTGRPVPETTMAVTVLHRRCIDADAFATGLLVLGPERGMALAAQENLAARFILRRDGGFQEQLSPALLAMLDEDG